MSIKTRIAAAALAALTVTASVATTASSAQAKPLGWGWGVGAGIATAAIVGGAIAASNDPYAYGHHRCGWVAQYDAFGHYLGSFRTCY